MTPSPTTCPKCGSRMLEDKHLEALGCHVELVPSEGFLGDRRSARYWDYNMDFNGDGKVDILDVIVLARNFGKSI